MVIAERMSGSATVGDPVVRKHQALSVELGPGIMDTIFDGIQRPLNDIANLSGDVFIPRGVDIACLNPVKTWQFTPTNFREGECFLLFLVG